jgi:hypothetical protein
LLTVNGTIFRYVKLYIWVEGRRRFGGKPLNSIGPRALISEKTIFFTTKLFTSLVYKCTSKMTKTCDDLTHPLIHGHCFGDNYCSFSRTIAVSLVRCSHYHEMCTHINSNINIIFSLIISKLEHI